MCRITFRPETVKRLQAELAKAYGRGDKRAVRRLSVLLMVGKRIDLGSILSLWDVSTQTIYNWLNEFVRSRWKSLGYEKSPGRPSGLTKTQKRKLAEWIKAGPEACGYARGCWTSVLIQDLIWKKFHVLYNRFYVCELLRNLGFSFQKARFVSDHLDAEARQRWYHSKLVWLQIMWILFTSQLWKAGHEYIAAGDEVVFGKAGKETYGIGRFFSSLQNRVIPGLSFFAFSLIDVQERQSYPIQVVQMVKKAGEKTQKDKQKSAKAKKRAVGRPKGSKNKKDDKPKLSPELLRIQPV